MGTCIRVSRWSIADAAVLYHAMRNMRERHALPIHATLYIMPSSTWE